MTQEQLEKMTEIREKQDQKKAEREKMTPSEKSRKITYRMTKHLELDDEQQNSVYEINKKYITLFDDAKSQGYNKEAIMDIRFRQKAEISKVLSEEQKKKLITRHARR
ncbi:MAG: hypothetical protein Kapaf2KO_07630 [Candidatus Kapaibacteriales bacterium]